ncbi:TspO/MBR family protein [Paenisporosarcina cavernae]|uniref:Tryptophan-rich sensory protein n=1 Tax=Paenisporosarcina cavernae TaxID=2320858 RepID=A0A385YX48_9BACL|nr:TspO/MBR family protein [Paenisporosarcina cavernae]AYC30258.1 tryptophan-rich sensory protein [Paenisporosarcina cavernae]
MYVLSFIGWLAVVIVNALSNILPFNGQTTGEISNRIPVLFTPAGYVFSIWSLIYVLAILWIYFQWKNRQNETPHTRKQLTLFLLSCIWNISWIFSWHYEYFLLSVIIMLAFLVTLILLYHTYPKTGNKWYEKMPISVYLGWISVATIANISYVLTYYEWSGWGLSDPLWTVIMMTIGAALALHIRYHEYDIAYPLVFIWAFIGIAVRNGFDELLVSTAALFLAAVILAGILFIKKKEK